MVLDTLPKGQKCSQEYFVQNMVPSLLSDKKLFSPRKAAITFSVQMDNSICCNRHQVVDELCRLKILRALHPPESPYISPCDFWMFKDFKDKTEGLPSASPRRNFEVISRIVG
jgi:hypothetical protein